MLENAAELQVVYIFLNDAVFLSVFAMWLIISSCSRSVLFHMNCFEMNICSCIREKDLYV